MRHIFRSIGLFAMFFWIVQPAIADEGKEHGSHHGEEHQAKSSDGKHSHKAPHGGTVITVDTYHYEMVVKPKEIRIYLLDGSEKVLPVEKVEGNMVLRISEKPARKIVLEKRKDHLRAKVDQKDVDDFVALVSLKVDGKSRTGRFTYKKPEEHEKHGGAEGAHGAGGHSH